MYQLPPGLVGLTLSNCMRIVVSEEAAAVPASVEPGSLNNDPLDDEI